MRPMYQRSIRGEAMGWKATGQPTVRKQREKWVVRVDGIDTETGNHRPRQLGTYASQRSALAAARSVSAQERAASRDTVGWLVRRYVASRTDVTLKARAIPVGDPPHRGWTWGRPPRPTRPGGRRCLARRPCGGRWPFVALDPDLSHRLARCAGRRGGRGLVAPKSRGTSANAPHGRQSAEAEGGRGLVTRSGLAVPRRRRRTSVRRGVAARRALRTPEVRGPGLAMG